MASINTDKIQNSKTCQIVEKRGMVIVRELHMYETVKTRKYQDTNFKIADFNIFKTIIIIEPQLILIRPHSNGLDNITPIFYYKIHII